MGIPDFASHKAQQDQLTKQVTDLQADFNAGKVALSTKVAGFLKDWLDESHNGDRQKICTLSSGQGRQVSRFFLQPGRVVK